ncbi:histidine kinase [Desulfallas sp. Bu1-1]|uniref:histidine kinase n=1 Tax=Desulfallas sp. Bu1-1 TaxID=2787620 RepID=UPI00189E22CA|nr:histidine kinase [Desulfallas sp. Bu1-1]MBF7082769.1 histidine kinase [Desulfallas sp. Bu1-1]
MAEINMQKIMEQYNTCRLQFIDEQSFPWGKAQWINLATDGQKPIMRASIVTIYPKKEQQLHYHFGYEELLYGIRGETYQRLNGNDTKLTVGNIIHIPAEGSHWMYNPGDEDACFLSIVNPVQKKEIAINVNSIGEHVLQEINIQDVLNVINFGDILQKFAQGMQLGIILFDKEGNLISDPQNLPHFCRLCLNNNQGECLKKLQNNLEIFRCKYGVCSIQQPVIVNQMLLGYLGCGYRRLDYALPEEEQMLNENFPKKYIPLAKQKFVDLEMINKNRLSAAAEALSLISNDLVEVVVQTIIEKELNLYKLKLAEEEQRKSQLINFLNESRLRLLESQVNPHFLFNTLNTIAQSSLIEGAQKASRLTYALANLLRCSLGKVNSLITIKEELNYVNDYIFIQKNRFPDQFNFITDIDEHVEGYKIPFMTILVFVENAIIHGFREMDIPGTIVVKGWRESQFSICIQVTDDGIGIPVEVIKDIEKFGDLDPGSRDIDGLGIYNVFKRLEYFFKGNFKLRFNRLPAGGTEVTLFLPIKSSNY